MKTEVNMESLEGMSFADYKKNFSSCPLSLKMKKTIFNPCFHSFATQTTENSTCRKKDKKFLKKAKGVMFVNDHKFSDGKKGLAMIIFKKPKEVKLCFKELKKNGHPSPKIGQAFA